MIDAHGSRVILADCTEFLKSQRRESVDLVYIDPPFNTGKVQSGINGEYSDSFSNFGEFLYPVLGRLRDALRPSGSILVHLDHRESHYVKIELDRIFGRQNFMNEIVWSYDYGGRSKKYWPRKHDTILWYAKNCKRYTYNHDAQIRIPYMAPGLAGPEKAARGKTQTDVVFHTICPTNGNERTGYPTQKPIGLISQLIAVHSNVGDHVLDCFAGSGTTGVACKLAGRRYTLVDSNPQAIKVIRERGLCLEDQNDD